MNWGDVTVGVFVAVLGLLGLVLAGGALDQEIFVFGLGLFAFAIAFDWGLVRRRSAGPRRRGRGRRKMVEATDYPARPVIPYSEEVIKKFTIAAMFWAIVAFLVGVVIASQLSWPELSFGLSFLNFGRLRPVHTSAAIFAFGGNALFATSFYVVQRTCRARPVRRLTP